MNSSLASADFAKGRRAAGSSNESSLHRTARNLIATARSWLGKVISFAVARVVVIFFIGFAAGLAWQSYSGPARKAIARWSPHLAWVAPAAAPAGPTADQLKATSLALAAARQNIDKLATEIRKLSTPSEKKARAGRHGQGT